MAEMEVVDPLKKTLAVRLTRGVEFPVDKKNEDRALRVVLSLKEQSQSTKTAGKGAEPSWGETFYFDVSKIEIPAPGVFIVAEIFALKKVGDELLGTVRVPIDNHIDMRFNNAREQLFQVVTEEKYKGTQPTLGMQIGVADRLGADGFVADEIPIYTEDQLNQMSADQVYEAAILVAEKSHELMDRIERMAAQSESIGAATAKKLHEQTEQLKILDSKVEQLHANVAKGQEILDDINACCFTRCFTNCFSRRRTKKTLKKRAKDTEKFEREMEHQEQQMADAREKEANEKARQAAKQQKQAQKDQAKRLKAEGPAIERGDIGVTRSPQEERYLELRKRLDQRLDRLKDTVDRLMELANAMGDELDKQVVRIDHIDTSMADGQVKLDKAIVATKKAT